MTKSPLSTPRKRTTFPKGRARQPVRRVRIPDAPRSFRNRRHRRQSTPSEANDAPNISVINDAAKSFGSPADTAIHPTIDRQANAATSTKVLTPAAIRAHPNPRNINTPHNTESPPNIPPEISAVFAPAGFDKNPATPQSTRKIPKPTNQRPQTFISPIIDAARTRTSWIAQPQSLLRSADSLAPAHLACGGLWPFTPNACALRCLLPSVQKFLSPTFPPRLPPGQEAIRLRS